jgi:hypothetical protein
MLGRRLYKQGGVQLLVVTETLQSDVKKSYKILRGGKWYRLHEGWIEKSGETIAEIMKYPEGYIVHEESSESVAWINKYDLPGAEVEEM